jgi:hypothetical protein
VIELTQRVPQSFGSDGAGSGSNRDYFRGGCTLLVDAQTGRVAYSIWKPLSESRMERQREYVESGGDEGLAATYFGGVTKTREPFAMLHRI